MTQKDSEDFSIDYEFLSKYIRNDSDENKEKLNKENVGDFSSKNFESQKNSSNGTEILSRDGEGESYRENSIVNKKPWEKNKGFEESDESEAFDESDKSSEKIESQSKPLTDAKKEFIEHLENDSLTIDTCSKLNHDWKKK